MRQSRPRYVAFKIPCCHLISVPSQPFDITLYKMAADIYIASGSSDLRILKAIARYTRQLTEVAIQLDEAANSTPPRVNVEIANKALASALDYAMAVGEHVIIL